MVGEGEDLVVAQAFLECAMPCRPCGTFQAKAGRTIHVDVDDRQRYIQCIAGSPAMRGPGVGVGMQAVVHVDRAQAMAADVGIAREQAQQDRGIQAAAEADQYAPIVIAPDHVGQRRAHESQEAVSYAP